jgi:hypothetical protein
MKGFPKALQRLRTQAEQVEDRVFVGFRFLTGDSGVGSITDVEILNGPDGRLFNR